MSTTATIALDVAPATGYVELQAEANAPDSLCRRVTRAACKALGEVPCELVRSLVLGAAVGVGFGFLTNIIGGVVIGAFATPVIVIVRTSPVDDAAED